MARKSKYEPSSAKLSTALWKPALYIRLSREDGDREESNSIASQRELLTEFADAQTDMAAPRLYTDDGYTGTDFDRPNFQRMIDDLRAGVVNCVIVKDLSRFGRNYVGVGEYLEHIFPLLNVRFISVSDNVDSFVDPRSVNSLIVPFKNIINDEYCRDISNKVRASLDLKRRQGKFIGSFASYGYRKDPDDHSHLLIDEPAAAVVRDIFDWFIGGTSVLGIAKKLNAMGIPNPSAYKRQQGMNYCHPASDKLDTRIASLQTRIDEVQNGVDETNSFLSQFVKYRNLQKLTREVVVELIDMIYVHEGGKITIQFKFSDAYVAAQEYIQKHGQTA